MIEVHGAKRGPWQTGKSGFVTIEQPIQRHTDSPSLFFLKDVDGANLLNKPGTHAKVPSKSARPRPNIEEDATDSDVEPSIGTNHDAGQSTTRRGSRRGVLRPSASHGRDMAGLRENKSIRPHVTVEQRVPTVQRVDFDETESYPSPGRKASESDSQRGGRAWNTLYFPEPPSSRGSEKRITSFFMPWDQRLKHEHEFSNHLSSALHGIVQASQPIAPQSSWGSEGSGFVMKGTEGAFLIEGDPSTSSWSHRKRRDFLKSAYGLSPRAVVYGSSVGTLPGFPAAPTTGSFTPYQARAPHPITSHVQNSMASMNGRGFAPMSPAAALRTQRSREFRQRSGTFGPRRVPDSDIEDVTAVRDLPDYESTTSEEDKGTFGSKAHIVKTPGPFSDFVGGKTWRPRLLRPIEVLEIPEDASPSSPNWIKSTQIRTSSSGSDMPSSSIQRRGSVMLTPRMTPRRSPHTRRLSINDFMPAESVVDSPRKSTPKSPASKASTPGSSFSGTFNIPTRSSGIRTMSPEGEGSMAPGKFDLIAKHGLLNMQNRFMNQLRGNEDAM